MKRTGLIAAMAAASLMLGGCLDGGGAAVARLGERLAPQLLTYLGPTASALLGPEVALVVNLLQSQGAAAVERAVDMKLAQVEDKILRGEIATPAAAQAAYDKAAARMKLLRQLRRGNDYSQMLQRLTGSARAALDRSRAAVDARYEAVRVALVDLGAVEVEAAFAHPMPLTATPASLADVGQRPATAPKAESLTWEQVIALCTAAIYDDQMARVAAELAAMPEGVRKSAMVVCAAFAEGVAAERGKVPAGAAVAI